ncbi:MAG: hypothetical protein JRJ38_19380, partial [Deltaproteobacteria bacterium]|nr:hypothetical protein [Deltaproteobacteria bacterium]
DNILQQLNILLHSIIIGSMHITEVRFCQRNRTSHNHHRGIALMVKIAGRLIGSHDTEVVPEGFIDQVLSYPSRGPNFIVI